jgi:hypothetical protein
VKGLGLVWSCADTESCTEVTGSTRIFALNGLTAAEVRRLMIDGGF